MRLPLPLILILALLTNRAARAVDLVAGPMVGHVTDKSARIWMQFPIAGEVTVTVYDIEKNSPVSAVRVGLEGPTPFVCDVPMGSLAPDRSYRLDLKFDGQPVKSPEMVIRTAPAPGDEATFSVAFGSGLAVSPLPSAAAQTAPQKAAAPEGPIPIFKAITDLKPRAFFFLGNTGYLPPTLNDFPATHRAAFRYLNDFHSLMRRQPALQELFHTTPCYALFNDRDFGPRDADARFVYAQESLVAFQRFWPNPDWGTPESPGCYCTFTFGDADFFFLDMRTFRDAALPAKPCLGAAQLDWLKKGLKASRAQFKVLAAPCALWGAPAASPAADSWSQFPAEQHDFLQWLSDNQINGLMVLAGNQPAGQLLRFEPPASSKLRYPIFTLGCSTLGGAAGLRPASLEPPMPDPLRVGQIVAGNSFGTLDFSGQSEHRFAALRLRDEAGKVRAEQIIFAVQLHN